MTHTEPARLAVNVEAYDARAWLYDLVVGSRLYHQLVWGMAPVEHRRFVEHALRAAPPGPVLDAGCGSALFTAAAYRASSRRLTLLDASAAMLGRARRRLGAAASSSRVHFECGNLYGLPYPDGAFSAVFHFGVLHCLTQPEIALSELSRVLAPGGKLFLSCLILARPRGDAFLKRLERAGHVAAPKSAAELRNALESAQFCVTDSQLRGSFSFLEATK